MLIRGAENNHWKLAELTLEPDDGFLMYTDGWIEAVTPQNEPFGFDRMRSLAQASATDPAAFPEQLLAAHLQHRRHLPQPDDLTILVLVRKNAKRSVEAS